MNDIGYLYVLANSSMPGLVKIGKTTRSPAERASELSGATGLPSPFIVVYEQLFNDCSAAESFVHTLLSAKGFRVSTNREFFSAAVNDVVRAIALAPGSIDNSSTSHTSSETLDFGATEIYTVNTQIDLQRSPSRLISRSPWEAVFEEAEAHYAGSGALIQDFTQAFKLFKQAAKLGSLFAFGRIGDMCLYGKGVPINETDALDSYREGAKKGSAYCYWAMGMFFYRPYDVDRSNIHMGNVEKCFLLFLKSWKDRIANDGSISEVEIKDIDSDCVVLIKSNLFNKFNAPIILGEFYIERSVQICSVAQNFVDNASSWGYPASIPAYQMVVDFFHKN